MEGGLKHEVLGMLNEILLYAGSLLIIIWGIGHIAPTKGIVAGFGPISEDNKKIILMEWVIEGLAFLFVGFLVISVTYLHGYQNPVSATLYWLSAGFMLVLAGWSAMTGARTSVLPMKLCPFIKTTVAILYILGIIL
jgi:hypothetical protein